MRQADGLECELMGWDGIGLAAHGVGGDGMELEGAKWDWLGWVGCY